MLSPVALNIKNLGLIFSPCLQREAHPVLLKETQCSQFLSCHGPALFLIWVTICEESNEAQCYTIECNLIWHWYTVPDLPQPRVTKMQAVTNSNLPHFLQNPQWEIINRKEELLRLLSIHPSLSWQQLLKRKLQNTAWNLEQRGREAHFTHACLFIELCTWNPSSGLC